MATKVKQTYTPSLNLSVTTRGGRVDRVTVWTTGDPKSTEVVYENPKRR